MFKIFALSAIATGALLLTGEVGFAGDLAAFCDTFPNDPLCTVVAVPEPGALALIATGLGVLMVAKFRKRK